MSRWVEIGRDQIGGLSQRNACPGSSVQSFLLYFNSRIFFFKTFNWLNLCIEISFTWNK